MNQVKELVDMLGVKISSKEKENVFRVKGHPGDYKINQEGKLFFKKDKDTLGEYEWEDDAENLFRLINGDWKIVSSLEKEPTDEDMRAWGDYLRDRENTDRAVEWNKKHPNALIE